jgi:ribosomal-protein-alanine N-acetyltransferase
VRGVKIREAQRRDYGAIHVLYRELAVPDPAPDEAEWARDLMPATLVVDDDGAVGGFATFRGHGASGRVVHVVVAPERRRRGVALALMRDVARRLRAAGCERWHLNVREDNAAARALYETLGLRVSFVAQTLCLDDAAIFALPSFRGVRVSTAGDAEAVALETLFALSAGALWRRRGVTLRADLGSRAVGVARLAPSAALAAPFRLRDHRAARPFFVAMQRWIDQPRLRVVVEADPRLGELLCARGATEELRLLHMEGKLR